MSLNLFSLHEVSTGFYPELTCRENIFLNGAIPGMRKEEIKNVKNQDLTPFCHAPPDDPAQRQPDISLAKEALRWEPIVDLETGLRRTIEYFKKLLYR